MLSGDSIEEFSFADWEKSLMHLAGSPDGTPVVYGDDGVALVLRGGVFEKLDTALSENLRSLDIHPTTGVWAAAGNFGDFALGTSRGLEAMGTGKELSFTKALVRDDGSVALALIDKNSCEWRNGEIRDFDRPDSKWTSIVGCKGTEFWGDSDFGVFFRDDCSFKPAFETEGAGTMHATDSHLLVNTFEFLHVYDGHAWTSFQAKGGKKRPIVAVDCDFECSWP